MAKMPLPLLIPHPDRPDRHICGSPKPNQPGKICLNPAGARTTHLGEGRCWRHGGMSPVKTGRWSYLKKPTIRKLAEAHAADPDPLNMLEDLALARAIAEDYINRYDENAKALLAWHSRLVGRPLNEDRLRALVRMCEECERLLRESGEEISEAMQEDFDLARETIDKLADVNRERPVKILDIADAGRMIGDVTKIVERIEKIKAANAVSRADLLRVTTEMGRISDNAISQFGDFLHSIFGPEDDRHEQIDAAIVSLKHRIQNGWVTIRVG